MKIIHFFFLCCFCFSLWLVDSKASSISEACCPKHQRLNLGVVIDQSSRVGKEQKTAMELAVHDFDGQFHCLNLLLHVKDSHGSIARAASAAIDLINHNQVDAIIGTITLQEAALLSEFRTDRSIPIISLSPAASAPRQMAPKFSSFIQMGASITYQMQCIAALVGHFRWTKVILIHEQGNGFSEDSGLLTRFLDSLRAVDASIEHHLAFPRVSSLFDPKACVEKELKKLRNRNVRIFVVLQSSLELSVFLFEKAKELGMMEKGYAWIVSDEIANLLNSVDWPVILNMQGVLGLKTDNADKSENVRQFKSRFRRKYRSEYSAEEENLNPSIYSFLAYDSIWSLAKASQNSQGKINSTGLANRILSSEFEGLSGKISFMNGVLSQKHIFRIVNVIGRSYREVALWSPELGFSEDLVELDGKRMGLGSGLTGELSSIYWPGGEQTVPKGWSFGSKEKPLRIGVPAKGAFHQFVNVTYDSSLNKTLISGFSIEVFEAAVKQLPYDLHYVFIPYDASYDEMVAEVHKKNLDAAVGDTEIMADRYAYADFSQPYLESGLLMVVATKQGLQHSRFIALNVFTKKMWIQFAGMSICTGFIVWLSEYASGNEQFTINSLCDLICSVLWLSVTIISFSQRETIKDNASKLVLAAWISVVFVVAASFTAVLSSIMTVPRLQGVPDVDYLRNTNAPVGCNGNSFIDRYLINALNFKPENVRGIDSINDYPRAFETGEIKAAFFVAPHAKVFLSKYCKGYTTSGPSFKLGGFGFVFQKGSPLTVDISEAVLKVTQSGQINTLEKHVLRLSSCSSSTSGTEGGDDMRLGPEPFSGLFQVLGTIIGVAFVVAIVRLVRMKMTSAYDLMMKRICQCASLVLAERCTRLGSTFSRKEGIQTNVPRAQRGSMEPNLVVTQVPVNCS